MVAVDLVKKLVFVANGTERLLWFIFQVKHFTGIISLNFFFRNSDNPGQNMWQ